MRTSSRRRVMPVPSRRASSGSAYLRLVPHSSRISATVTPSGLAANIRGDHAGRLIDGAGGEEDAVLLDHQAAANELTQLAAVDVVGRRWLEWLRLQLGDERVVGQRVDDVADADVGAVDLDAIERLEDRSLTLVEAGEIEPQRPRLLDGRLEGERGRFEHVGVDDPAAEAGLAALARCLFEEIDVDPRSLGDEAFHRAVGCGTRRPRDRIHVEDPTAADRLAAPTLSEHEAVAGDHRQRTGEVQSREARLAGSDRVGAEDAHADRVFARTDVDEVGATSGDLVIQSRQDRDLGIDHRRAVPLAVSNEHVAAGELVVVDVAQVHRQAASGQRRR